MESDKCRYVGTTDDISAIRQFSRDATEGYMDFSIKLSKFWMIAVQTLLGDQR
jgi:hypothetical protein